MVFLVELLSFVLWLNNLVFNWIDIWLFDEKKILKKKVVGLIVFILFK